MEVPTEHNLAKYENDSNRIVFKKMPFIKNYSLSLKNKLPQRGCRSLAKNLIIENPMPRRGYPLAVSKVR